MRRDEASADERPGADSAPALLSPALPVLRGLEALAGELPQSRVDRGLAAVGLLLRLGRSEPGHERRDRRVAAQVSELARRRDRRGFVLPFEEGVERLGGGRRARLSERARGGGGDGGAVARRRFERGDRAFAEAAERVGRGDGDRVVGALELRLRERRDLRERRATLPRARRTRSRRPASPSP